MKKELSVTDTDVSSVKAAAEDLVGGISAGYPQSAKDLLYLSVLLSAGFLRATGQEIDFQTITEQLLICLREGVGETFNNMYQTVDRKLLEELEEKEKEMIRLAYYAGTNLTSIIRDSNDSVITEFKVLLSRCDFGLH